MLTADAIQTAVRPGYTPGEELLDSRVTLFATSVLSKTGRIEDRDILARRNRRQLADLVYGDILAQVHDVCANVRCLAPTAGEGSLQSYQKRHQEYDALLQRLERLAKQLESAFME